MRSTESRLSSFFGLLRALFSNNVWGEDWKKIHKSIAVVQEKEHHKDHHFNSFHLRQIICDDDFSHMFST